jgi:hypothetical protein
MRRVRRELVPLVLALLAATACSSSPATTTTTPTNTTPITETFPAASVSTNGAVTFTFAVSVAGPVSATLLTVSPDSTIVMGLALGTWNGTACTVAFHNDNAMQGTTIAGNISAAGNLCVRVYDVGFVTHPETINAIATHL